MSNLKKYNFDFDLTGLQSYTEQKTSTLISETILEGDFASIVQVVPNVKGVQELNVLSSSLTAQAGGCGWDPFSGNSTTYTQKSITSVKKQFQESLCADDLEGYWLQTLLKPGQYYENVNDVPFVEYLVNYKVQQVKEAVELLEFQATSGGTGFDGFIKLTGTGYTGDNVTYVAAANTGLTAANIGDVIDIMLAQGEDYLLAAKDGFIAMSWANFTKYTQWLRNKNYFYYDAGNGQSAILHPGTLFEIRPVHGLIGSNRIFISKKSNFFIGTDLVSDYSKFLMWHSMDNQEVRMKCQFRLGTQTGADQILSNGMA